MKTVIVIPARYGSSRFPGKPLFNLAGKTMLQRVCEIALKTGADFLVATDDEKIKTHCQELNVNCVMTSEDCKSGSDRVLQAVAQLSYTPDFIINLQGDAPFVLPEYLTELINAAANDETIQVATIASKLTWTQLDKLRQHKINSPFSGTTVIIDKNCNGIWFSKNIIPAIRKEVKLRQESAISPIYRHIGVYGYRYDALQQFSKLPGGYYEQLEGLEQLRFIENGYNIRVVAVTWPYDEIITGIDTPEDAKLFVDYCQSS